MRTAAELRRKGGALAFRTSVYLEKKDVELLVNVDADYEPPQRQTYTDPGFDECVEITSVRNNGIELLSALPPECIANLEVEALEFAHSLMDEEAPECERWDREEGSLDYFNRYQAGDR